MHTSLSRPLRVFGATFVALAVLLAPVSAPAATSPKSQLFQMVNNSRERNNRHPVDESRKLTRRAERNSRAMARKGALSHSGPLHSGMGEDVGSGPTLKAVMRAFMHSDIHRRVILGRSFKHVGVGVAKSHGMFWVTLTFT